MEAKIYSKDMLEIIQTSYFISAFSLRVPHSACEGDKISAMEGRNGVGSQRKRGKGEVYCLNCASHVWKAPNKSRNSMKRMIEWEQNKNNSPRLQSMVNCSSFVLIRRHDTKGATLNGSFAFSLVCAGEKWSVCTIKRFQCH